jgi:hypothetical protein
MSDAFNLAPNAGRVDAKRLVQADDLRVAALHGKLISQCIAAK